MSPKVAIIYNKPIPYRYSSMGEEKAILGVLDEVEAVYHALTELQYPVLRIPLLPPLVKTRNTLMDLEADLVFNLFEGFDGCPKTEAIIADILSELLIPYTGCPGAALALALDKAKTKALLSASGIETPEFQLLSPETLGQFCLKYPCIVKPCGEDASHGLSEDSVVNDYSSLKKQLIKVSGLFGGKALVEQFLQGREFNATVIGNKEPVVLPISEIVYSLPPSMPRILTFASKWDTQSTYYQCTKAVCPAEIGDEDNEVITQTAVSVFKLLGCRGYARVDMRMDAEGRVKVLEVNPNPDISHGAGVARQVKAAGLTFAQFIRNIIMLALEKE